jgi:hypothetical protein
MRYNISPAWDAGYAIPDNVRDEPLRRSYLREGYALPRGFYDAPAASPAWNPGYALPANVRDEGIGTNPIVSYGLARRTIGAQVPPLVPGAVEDIIDAGGAGTPEMNALSGSEWMDAQSWRYGFGDDSAQDARPLDEWAKDVAAGVVAAVRGVQPGRRTAALKMALNELEPGLAVRVESTTRKLVSLGLPKSQALRVAIQDNVKAGLIQEALDLAYGHAPKAESLMGLGIDHAYNSYFNDGYADMAGIWSSIKKGAKKVGGAVKTAATKTGSAVKTAATKTGSAIKHGAEDVYDAAKDAAKWAGKATCTLLSSEKGQLAIAAGAGVAGAPPDKALVGAQVGAGLCAGAAQGQAPPPPPARAELPVGLIIGGAAVLGAILIVSSNRKPAAAPKGA